MSRGESSPTRFTSTASMTASKIFSRGECWKPTVTRTTWPFLYLLLSVPGIGPRLLAPLALRCLGGRLSLVDVPLRQREHRTALYAHRDEMLAAAQPPDDDAARRELADHRSRSCSTSGTKRTGATASSPSSRKRIRCSSAPLRTGQMST